MKRIITVLALGLSVTLSASAQKITSPQEVFGFQLGADRKLADWKELTAYYQKLAKESDRIRYEEVGKTTEGRPYVTLTISSAENLAHLERYREIQNKLSDPRITSEEEAKKLAAEGKTVVVITANVHSTEIASSQSIAEYAYRLATQNDEKTKRILDNVILVIVPSQNPDGQQLVVDWYKKYVGTPYEGSSPVVIYHHYTGHDDNRDWATFTQVETRNAVEKVINPWKPEILYDLHQQGTNSARIYLPPFVDPIDPNIDPIIVSSINALGSNIALEIGQTGKKGVESYGVYDFWSPLRDYIGHHNGLRILTESASVNIASPVNIPFERLEKGIGYDAKRASWNFPNPWQGGEWHLRDIVDYQLDALFSLANNAALYRERYLTNFYTVAKHNSERKDWANSYVIPSGQEDSAAVQRLINTLRIGETEVKQATADFDADGQHFKAGSYIVHLNQPFGAYAKSVLEIQHYPNIPEYPGGPLQRPYDVTAQTLPLLFGVKAVEVKDPVQVAVTDVDRVKTAAGKFERDAKAAGYLIDDHTNTSLYALFSLLGKGVKAYRLTGANVEAGTIYLPKQKDLDTNLAALVQSFPITVRSVAAAPTGTALEVHLPRIALYQSWVASMDEGWTRFIFDQNKIPYTRLVDEEIRKGDLNKKYDVVVIPDNAPRAITTGRGGFFEEVVTPTNNSADAKGTQARRAPDAERTGPKVPDEFTGGLGETGVASLKAFVENGGTVVALNKASQVYTTNEGPVSNALASVNKKDFYIPGSILEVAVDRNHPIAFGSPATVPVFFEQSPSFTIKSDAKAVATYASDNSLLSGWILGGQYLKGTAAIVDQTQGKGHIILFGFRPQYRAISEVSYKFLFNSLLYATSTSTTLSGAKHGL